MTYVDRLDVSQKIASVLDSWVENLKDGDYKSSGIVFSNMQCLCRVINVHDLLFG